MIDLDRIQSCVRNSLDPAARTASRLAGVIGDAPSHYSRSPAIWNEAFRAFHIDAMYIALDVDDVGLAALMAAVRECGDLLGLNVTVPHKIAVIKFLDTLEESAKRIGAVNTIVRSSDGRLAGANTDGAGFIETLLVPGPDEEVALFQSLEDVNALVLGAGGSARAVAFALAEKIGAGKLLIANRSYENGRALAREVGQYHPNTFAIAEEEIPKAAPDAKLIVNCTIKGQAGIEHRGTPSLEAYSALAPAAGLSGDRENIEENHRTSVEIARSVPRDAVFYDLVYHPEETVFMRHGRASGHRVANGRGMIVAQAAEAFFNHICRHELEAAGRRTSATQARLREIMNSGWMKSTIPRP
ncbi:MAG TPA: shikimate dehydrogenase [Verrucomicrobiae bacterium]|jgi:shikimate dehydrogenase|nr:shikimate dehydrogenase [Verrucomicrobiae bacterium]